MLNTKGYARVENLEFPEDFPAGKYVIKVSDYTLDKFGIFKSEKIDLTINPMPG